MSYITVLCVQGMLILSLLIFMPSILIQRHLLVYMEMDVLSTLAYENNKDKKGNPPNHSPEKQTYTARDTWMHSLENFVACTCTFVYSCVHAWLSSEYRMPKTSDHPESDLPTVSEQASDPV